MDDWGPFYEIHIVQSLSNVWLFVTPWAAPSRLPCPSLSPGVCSNSCSLSWWCSLIISSSAASFSFCLQSSQHQSLFQWVSSSNPMASVLELQFPISPSNKYSGLISCRIDWLDLLSVHGILKSLFQHHNSKASILWHSVFFIVQPSRPYMATGITIKVMSV